MIHFRQKLLLDNSLQVPAGATDGAELVSDSSGNLSLAAPGLVGNTRLARAVAISNITLSGLQTVDGVSLAAGDSVLVVGQSNSVNNGLYVVASGAWSRSPTIIISGMLFSIAEGTYFDNTQWVLFTQNPITVGTTALSFGMTLVPKPIGFLDGLGHSHAFDVGSTVPDYGMMHKIDSLLEPATYRNTALGGAVHSSHDQGNGAGGDGGWSHAIAQFPRDEEVTGYGQTTMTSATVAGANTALPVSDRTAFYPSEFVVVGRGTTTEICQISSSYAGATGAGNITVNSTANAHSSADAVYHAVVGNVGAYLAKSELVVLGTGLNDLPYLGPFAQGTFGTTAGASRGLQPLQNALRFTLAQMRCSVIYPNTHPSNSYSGVWAAGTALSLLQGGVPWTNPPVLGFGAFGGGFQTTSAASAAVTFSTSPDFPGGTVDVFFMTGNPTGTPAADASGALWNIAVTGATTLTLNSAVDTRSKNAVPYGNSTTTGRYTGVCYRITGLNQGVNTITVTAATIGTVATYLGWGIEAPQPPYITTFLDPRCPSYTAYGASGYYTRTQASPNQATVAANAGTVAGSVTLNGAVTVGTTGTGQTAVYPGDTITIGTGTTKETRRIVGIDSTTALHVDSIFLNAHTNEACVIGLQNADIVGGGYENTNDTQGATSVPGLQAAFVSVVNEFDNWVRIFNTDTYLNPPGVGSSTLTNSNFAADYLHYSNNGHALLAAAFNTHIMSVPWSVPQIALPTVPNKRTWNRVYGEAYPAGQPATGQASLGATFVNGWTNYYPLSTSYAPCEYYKDMKTRMVFIRGAVTNNSISEASLPSGIFVLPVGYRPAFTIPIQAYSSQGPAVIEVLASGGVYCSAGFFGPNGLLEFYGSFLAEA